MVDECTLCRWKTVRIRCMTAVRLAAVGDVDEDDEDDEDNDEDEGDDAEVEVGLICTCTLATCLTLLRDQQCKL